MQAPSFIELLLNENNIAGFWAVIGAVIALLGIFLNNLWESARQKKERQQALIKETYFGAIEYINYSTNKILNIGREGKIENDTQLIAASEKFYKSLLIASPELTDFFTKLSLKFSDIILKLSESSIDIQLCNTRIESHKQSIDSAIKTMNLAVADMQKYNERSINDSKLWEAYLQRNEKANKDFDENTQCLEILQKQEFELKIKIIKESIELLLTTYPETFNAMLIMRKELDRKLSKKDSRKIEQSFDLLRTQLEASLISNIDKLKDRILTMA